MPVTRLVVLGDAHVGPARPDAERALLAFLPTVPSLGDGLLLAGDLFEFWFGYRHAMPSEAVRVLGAVHALAQRVPVFVLGGNHDRWGRELYSGMLGCTYSADALDLTLGARRVRAEHGDAAGQLSFGQRAKFALVRSPLTHAAFGALHPDVGLPLVHGLKRALASPSTDAWRARTHARQLAYARERFSRGDAADLLIMGHSHTAEVAELAPGRVLLNAGAWFDGWRYAIADETDATLHRFVFS